MHIMQPINNLISLHVRNMAKSGELSKRSKEEIVLLIHRQFYKKTAKALDVPRDIAGSIVTSYAKKEVINGCHLIPEEARGPKPSTESKGPAARLLVFTLRHRLNPKGLHA
ncbi:hypothetical protein ATANTOWER_018610 [Ataeniobius toweri]|uniref:Uncharacterized protein n=1 Tax=Ataeniobius toweri TaxID=208326 RepID=A0ABU7CA95_9TELE|nr:hypothetical protein [Ataeniobius toweri]